MFGQRLSHLNKLIRNLNHHLGHRTSAFGNISTACSISPLAPDCRYSDRSTDTEPTIVW
jgi:hypothetical protein